MKKKTDEPSAAEQRKNLMKENHRDIKYLMLKVAEHEELIKNIKEELNVSNSSWWKKILG